MPVPPTLDYRTPRPEQPARIGPEQLFRLATYGSAIAGGVGVFILLVYVVTRFGGAAALGFFWLLPGGLIALLAGAAGLGYVGIAWRNDFDPPHTQRRAIVAIGCPILTVLAAFACVRIGTALLDASGSYPFGYSTVTLVLINTTNAPIDQVTAFGTGSPTGTDDLGSILPGATVEKSVTIPPSGDGSAHLTIRSGGQTWDQEAIGYYTSGGHHRPEETIRIRPPAPTTQP